MLFINFMSQSYGQLSDAEWVDYWHNLWPKKGEYAYSASNAAEGVATTY